MTAPDPARSVSGRRRRLWPWIVGGLFLLLVTGALGGKAWVESYLRSEKFRSFVGRKAGRTLEASAELSPITVSGQSFYAEGFKAHGYEGTWFSEIQLGQLRADLSTRRFSERVWQVDQVDVQRVEVKIDGDRLPKPEKAIRDKNADGFDTPSFVNNLLPNRVEIANATIRDANVAWQDGGVSGTAMTVTPQDGGWAVQANGGKVTHAKLPATELIAARFRFKEPSLFVQEAALRQDGGGTVNVSGELKLNDSLDFLAKLENVSMTPYLEGDWRARLRGKVSGDIRVRSAMPIKGTPEVSGTLRLTQGQLEALPILDTIASFTRTSQFRRINLTRATAEFSQSGDELIVSKFSVESEGLIKAEGSFTVKAGQIVGDIQLGVTPSSLQWLPGSQEKVFTASREGYQWAPVRLTGPADKPKEDLSPRLVAAAKSALFDSVGDATGTATDNAKDLLKGARDAARSAVDILLGK